MAKTTDNIAIQYMKLRVAVKDKMKELINTKGEKVDGDYAGMRYVPTESQQKNLAMFTDGKIVSVGISDKVSGGIYVEGDNRNYTAFDIITFQSQFNILACLTDYLTN